MRKENVIDRILDMAETFLAVFVGICMIVMTIGIVIWRYILNTPLTWGEEAARYMTVWFIYIGVAVGAKRRGHLGVEAFTAMLPRGVCTIVNRLADIVAIMILMLLSCSGVRMMVQYASTKEVSTMMRIPMYAVFCIVPIGLLISAYHYCRNFICVIKDTGKPSDKPEEVGEK